MHTSRRDFIKVLGGGAVSATLATGCNALSPAGQQPAPATATPADAAPALTTTTQPVPSVTPAATTFPTDAAPKDASAVTRQVNAALQKLLPFVDQQDFADAQRGFIATLPEIHITTESGSTAWTLKGYDFLKQSDPLPTVNPSLWRMAQLNMSNGLFQVTDRVYQVRGFDISNMTIIEGDSGLIIIDPLSTPRTAQAGLEFYRQQRGTKPVVAVIHTHSHLDHYGGVKGVTSDADVAARKVAVLAPEGFMEAAVSENVFVGAAMSRRVSYMYGLLLEHGAKGEVDVGIGKAYPVGASSLIAPTDVIRNTGDKRVIDGVQMEFQLVSGTEAPAEMSVYFPQFKALDSAEIACPLLHNILTLRGAQVRDAKKWASSLNDVIARYGDQTEVVLAQHNWPKWGQANIVTFLADQRDMYEYLHDQTLRLTNRGYTGTEIAEMLKLPASLSNKWYTRSYYGSLSHNAKAIYQKYIGWYDGNPANLNALPPVEAGKKFVEYMGGAEAAIARARSDFEKGEYRWVAQVMSHVVFADPDNVQARNLEADALEQLGYQAEASTWRNCYLVGASELRNGIPKVAATSGSANADTIRAMSVPLFFDFWGVRLNAEKADGKKIVINWTFTDSGEQYALNLGNSALTYRASWQAPNADLTLNLARSTLDAITLGQTQLAKEVSGGNVRVTGDVTKLAELLGMLDTFDLAFPVVTP
jgi:alkyl sulfatase BDS1-like metallo-beta-lactamase superfamily hydrolase